MRTYVPHQRARIDPLDSRHTGMLEIFAERHLRAPVGRPRAIVLDHEALDVDAGRLGVVGIDSDVPDLRVGHADDLPFVRRIGEHFLVTGHRGIEDDFAHGLADRAEGSSAKNAPVGQRQYRLSLCVHARAPDRPS